jgi:hypothetical protein
LRSPVVGWPVVSIEELAALDASATLGREYFLGVRSMKLDTKPSTTPATRRGLIVGAGVAGAAVVAAKVMPGSAVATSTAASAVKPAVDTAAGGYQLTQHVLRYYETTRA